MTLDEALGRLRAHEGELKRLGVEHLFVFGSTVRGEAGPASDVDLFLDYRRGQFGLFELMDVKSCAAKILGQAADVTTRDSLHHALRRDIEQSAVRVF
jgi:uncharacterized protein